MRIATRLLNAEASIPPESMMHIKSQYPYLTPWSLRSCSAFTSTNVRCVDTHSYWILILLYPAFVSEVWRLVSTFGIHNYIAHYEVSLLSSCLCFYGKSVNIHFYPRRS